MEYQKLGNTGLLVSRISFGNMVNNQEKDFELNTEIIKTCLDLGINFFDTAEIYESGQCEIQLGRSFKKLGVQREKVVVSTKLINFQPKDLKGNAINRNWTSCRKHVIEGINESLKRLDLDYVDVVFVHAYDADTPVSEVCEAFNQIIEDGKAFYWATSNWPSARIQEAFAYCDAHKLIRPIADQQEYNQLKRNFIEQDLKHLLDQGYGLTVYSPLGGGFLTGKYNDGKGPQNARANTDLGWLSKEMSRLFFFKDIEVPLILEKLNKLGDIAKELGFTQAQLALAWVLRNKDVSTAIIGARHPDQVRDCVKSLELLKLWTPELEERIEKILNNAPVQEVDFRTWEPAKNRRLLN